MRNCGECSACLTVMPGSAPPGIDAMPGLVSGARRMNSAAGISNTQATIAIVNCALRQSWPVNSQLASGEIVIGPMPMPADTSEAAVLRCLTNQPTTEAMVGAN